MFLKGLALAGPGMWWATLLFVSYVLLCDSRITYCLNLRKFSEWPPRSGFGWCECHFSAYLCPLVLGRCYCTEHCTMGQIRHFVPNSTSLLSGHSWRKFLWGHMIYSLRMTLGRASQSNLVSSLTF